MPPLRHAVLAMALLLTLPLAAHDAFIAACFTTLRSGCHFTAAADVAAMARYAADDIFCRFSITPHTAIICCYAMPPAAVVACHIRQRVPCADIDVVTRYALLMLFDNVACRHAMPPAMIFHAASADTAAHTPYVDAAA